MRDGSSAAACASGEWDGPPKKFAGAPEEHSSGRLDARSGDPGLLPAGITRARQKVIPASDHFQRPSFRSGDQVIREDPSAA